jgi:hypothetical protein
VGRTYRDAIGSEVTVVFKGQTLVKQLTAGDGFECSNERRLLFGLGESRSIDEIRIRWPGGHEQSYSAPSIDSDLLIIEDSELVLTLSKDET